MSPTKRVRIDKLSERKRAQMDAWAERWIEVGLRTGAADRTKFEAAAKLCYGYAGLVPPKVIIWVPSPFVLALAAPIAAEIIERLPPRVRQSRADAVSGAVGDAVSGAVRGAVSGAVSDAVGGAVRGAVDDAVGGAVRGAVSDAVRGAVGDAVSGAVSDAVGGAVSDAVRDAVDDAVSGAVRGAVSGAVSDAVDGAVRDAVGGAVSGAVGDAVSGAVDDAVSGAVDDAVSGAVDDAVSGAVRDAVSDAVRGAVSGAVSDAVDGAVRDAVDDAVRGAVSGAVGGLRAAIAKRWWNILGGQLWTGGYWYGAAWTSFFREVCGLTLKGDLWERAKSYEATVESACWWWPHRDFIMVCERPQAIHREEIGARGWGSHRIHNDTGPAVSWDGWGVWAIHGVRVPRHVVEAPHTVTVKEIHTQTNAEVQRVMIERYGEERYVVDSGMEPVAKDERFGDIYVKRFDAGRPIARLRVVNRSPEPDGSFRVYWLPFNPDHYGGDAGRIPQAAVASTWRKTPGGRELFFKKWQDYSPVLET